MAFLNASALLIAVPPVGYAFASSKTGSAALKRTAENATKSRQVNIAAKRMIVIKFLFDIFINPLSLSVFRSIRIYMRAPENDKGVTPFQLLFQNKKGLFA